MNLELRRNFQPKSANIGTSALTMAISRDDEVASFRVADYGLFGGPMTALREPNDALVNRQATRVTRAVWTSIRTQSLSGTSPVDLRRRRTER
jgi:hypothetical protein